MIRLFINNKISLGDTILLNENQIHYLKNVMRRNVSDEISVFNGKDGEWLSEIITLGKKNGGLSIKEQTKKQTDEPDIELIFAPVKQIDFLVQKATELGASSLQPVFTDRTVIRRVNIKRLESIAIEASEQCDRLTVPKIHQPMKLSELPTDRKIIVCDETGGGKPIKDILEIHTPTAILIGPEGGFSSDELASLQKTTIPVSLGPRILKAETAAIAALTCWQEHLGDWNNQPRK